MNDDMHEYGISNDYQCLITMNQIILLSEVIAKNEMPSKAGMEELESLREELKKQVFDYIMKRWF
jgi:hypothetical protein